MDRNAIFVLALANVPTILTVLIGILLNNGRLTDLNSRMGSFESKMTGFDNRLTHFEQKFDDRLSHLEQKFDTRLDLLTGKVIEIDNRLTRIEASGR